jgi:hypothetical protein
MDILFPDPRDGRRAGLLGWLAQRFAHVARLAGRKAADAAAIRVTALDYLEGCYTGDVARIERTLHPERVGRIARQGDVLTLDELTAEQLIPAATPDNEHTMPLSEQRKDITVLDIYRNAAVAKIVARDRVEYLQVVKQDGEWKIVAVLRELREGR